MTVLSDQELLQIVRAARALLSDPAHWSRRHYAEDAQGRWIPVGSSQAVRFSLEGALVHAAGSHARGAFTAIFDVFAGAAPDTLARLKKTPPDVLTHSGVLGLLDQAVAHLSYPAVRKRSDTQLRAVAPEATHATRDTKTRRG